MYIKMHKRGWWRKAASVLCFFSFRYALEFNNDSNAEVSTLNSFCSPKMLNHASIFCLFVFVQVNASGQFCGVAEMIGRVDFNKNMDFWQQDKWNGYFPVKWHIIKDVPNLHLRHIILENNDNKPVTNSRDTQEVCITN